MLDANRQPNPARCRHGHWLRGRRAVEWLLQRGDDGIEGRFVRTRLADGRHVPGAQLADDFSPRVGVPGQVVGQQLLQIQPPF